MIKQWEESPFTYCVGRRSVSLFHFMGRRSDGRPRNKLAAAGGRSRKANSSCKHLASLLSSNEGEFSPPQIGSSRKQVYLMGAQKRELQGVPRPLHLSGLRGTLPSLPLPSRSVPRWKVSTNTCVFLCQVSVCSLTLCRTQILTFPQQSHLQRHRWS